MSNYETAENRFRELATLASNARDIPEVGPLTRTDHDEMLLLAEYLGPRIPASVHSLLSGGFSTRPYQQRELGQRISRALDFISEYGEVGAADAETALLPTFSLAQADKDRVLELCTGMRKIIFASQDFDEPHKKRLLNRIAAIEKQVHSPKGLFDVVLGGVSDVGETLGKFGKDIKPLTDRMNEVVKITRKGTKEYDQIPAPEDIKRLPAPDDGSKEE